MVSIGAANLQIWLSDQNRWSLHLIATHRGCGVTQVLVAKMWIQKSCQLTKMRQAERNYIQCQVCAERKQIPEMECENVKKMWKE